MSTPESNPLETQLQKYLENVRTEPTHRNYWFTHKKIHKIREEQPETPDLKIALLSSFTIDLLAVYLDIDSRLLGFEPDMYVGPFNQYRQAIMDDQSKLNRENFDIIIIDIDLPSILPKNFLPEFPQHGKDTITDQIRSVVDDFIALLELLKSKSESMIIVSNFVVPSFSVFGILDHKQEVGVREFYRRINASLETQLKNDVQTYLFDLEAVSADFGKERMTNNSMYYRGTILYSEEFLPRLSRAYMGYVKALKNLNRKAIVLDLDNTLWGGIIGEDGMDGIKLNNNYPGKEFVEFQKLMLQYYNRGIILAINSKNNFEDAIEVIQDHPFMVLREEHFAAMKINWQDKVQNLVEIAQDLNIGIDSLVFVDDNPVERERVKQSLPQVLVVEMPENPADYVTVFKKLNDFNTLSLTREDLKRGEMYVARRKREDLKTNIQSMENFIESLEIKTTIRSADDFALPRVTSLVNRTNQFNLMTRRFTENQILDFHESEDMRIYTLQVTDKFGDEGIVGVAMVDTSDDTWRLVNFMMSCRVIGRRIETTFIYKILNDLHNTGGSRLTGDYIPTKKNKLVKNFYEDHGFQLLEKRDDGSSVWVIELEDKLDYPEFIEVIEDE